MRYTIFLFLLLFSTSSESQTLNYDWVTHISNEDIRYTRADVAIDNENNIFAIGAVREGMELNGESVCSSESNSVFIIKMNPNGESIWCKTYDNLTGIGSIKIDQENNIYLGGREFRVEGNDPYDADGYQTLIITKLNNDGEILWQSRSEERKNLLSERLFTTLDVDDFGNVYITGDFSDSLQIGDKKIYGGEYILYCAKFNTEGDIEWLKGANSRQTTSRDLSVNSNGEIFITGAFRSVFDMQGVVLNEEWFSTIYLIKLDNEGNLMYVKSYGESGVNRGFRLTVDKDDNTYMFVQFEKEIHIEDYYFEETPMAGANRDNVLLKYNAEDELEYAVQIGVGNGGDISADLEVDSDNNLFFCGYIQTGTPTYEQRLFKISSDGNVVSFCQIGNKTIRPQSLLVNNNSQLLISGNFRGPTIMGDYNFDPTEGTRSVFVAQPIIVEELCMTSSTIENEENDTDVKLVNETLIIDLNASSSSDILLTNSIGQVIFTKQIAERRNNLNVAHLPMGIYFLAIRSENDLYSYKFFKN